MPAGVEQHVAQHPVHLAWRLEEVQVIAIGEHLSVALGDAVHSTRQARADGHHATSERVPIVRFDDEMCVIALQGVVHQAERAALATVRERAFDGPDDPRVAE